MISRKSWRDRKELRKSFGSTPRRQKDFLQMERSVQLEAIDKPIGISATWVVLAFSLSLSLTFIGYQIVALLCS